MIFFIHYRPGDGEIFGWGSGFEPMPIEGMAVALFGEPVVPDPTMHKIDPATGAVIDKTPAEKRQALTPTVRQVQEAVFLELTRTDRFMLPDAPVDDKVYRTWKQYRGELRDLSKHFSDAAGMIEACDLAPDGVDPFVELRKRL